MYDPIRRIPTATPTPQAEPEALGVGADVADLEAEVNQRPNRLFGLARDPVPCSEGSTAWWGLETQRCFLGRVEQRKRLFQQSHGNEVLPTSLTL
jgi:hypothetical protein